MRSSRIKYFLQKKYYYLCISLSGTEAAIPLCNTKT